MGGPTGRRFSRRVQPATGLPDWRDEASYAMLGDADRSIFAWEWLRRDPGYRAAARRAGSGEASSAPALSPRHWGLHRFERPELAAADARPLWRADAHAPVLVAFAAQSGAPCDAFDLARMGSLATLAEGRDGREHLLLSDGLRAIRVDIHAGTLTRGPVQLRYLLAGFASAELPLLTLRRLLALCRTGQFSRALHPGAARAARFILELRAHDAIANGASQRQIAAGLLGGEAEQSRWRVHAPSLRSRVQRLTRAARDRSRNGYRSFLQA